MLYTWYAVDVRNVNHMGIGGKILHKSSDESTGESQLKHEDEGKHEVAVQSLLDPSLYLYRIAQQ